MHALKLARLLPLALFVVACSPQASVTTSQSLIIQGSDTEVQLVSALAEAFGAVHPDANISVSGGGSAVGIASLINGETDIANSSRQMKEDEITKAKERGADPKEFILARDGLSVIVHPENSVEALSVDQLSQIFSGKITNWKDVGGADAPIVLYGRQSTSGTFSFFRDSVVKDDYAADLRQMEGSQAIVDAVLSDVNAIGYVGVGYVRDASGDPRSDLKVMMVSKEGGQPVSPLDATAVENGTYPIARPIYQYLAKPPAAGSLAEMFLQFEVSPEAQAIIESSGFYPASAADKAANDTLFPAVR